MASRLSADVRRFAEKAKQRNLAIFRQSVQELAERSNVPIAQGGKMPVDTDFLRASQGASRVGLPYGPTKGQKDMVYQTPFSGPIALVTAQAVLGDTIWVGWTAEYAIYMEARYGFMRSEAQNWTYTVERITAEVRTRIP